MTLMRRKLAAVLIMVWLAALTEPEIRPFPKPLRVSEGQVDIVYSVWIKGGGNENEYKRPGLRCLSPLWREPFGSGLVAMARA